MKEKNWLWLVITGVSLFGLFIFLSVVTMNTDTVQRVFVIISEVLGVLTLSFAIAAWMKDNTRPWVYIGTVAFLCSWIMIAVAYEIGLSANTDNGWVWFLFYYIIAISGIVVMRLSSGKVFGKETLLPISMLFVAGIQLVYVLAVHIIWSLPF
ncbi:hypothetical protein [Salimicrobium flavidum]|uniref:Uncharacterized protein n=1 Tax=Salimicrobium flavidum TaxID=570947 RepID=A0A1N7JCT8_9BACI|nr:hypothetical protein [Salimicrobium flavidum]SIS47138.1 hypothetical protein SAMN05421687_10543 [Salimicrobium flavidum]